MGMFDAVVRWYKIRFASIEGLIDEDADGMLTDPYVIRVRFKEIILARTKRVKKFQEATAGQLAIKIKTEKDLGAAKIDFKKTNDTAQGYLAQAKKRSEVLTAQGKTPDEIKLDVDFMRSKEGYRSQNGNAQQKQATIDRLVIQLEKDQATSNKLEVQLTTEHRKLGDLERDAVNTEARAAAANARLAASELITGLSNDETVREHAALQKAIDKLDAQADVSERLAGTNSAFQDEQALQALQNQGADDDFDALVGLATKADGGSKATPVADTSVKLPE